MNVSGRVNETRKNSENNYHSIRGNFFFNNIPFDLFYNREYKFNGDQSVAFKHSWMCNIRDNLSVGDQEGLNGKHRQ